MFVVMKPRLRYLLLLFVLTAGMRAADAQSVADSTSQAAPSNAVVSNAVVVDLGTWDMQTQPRRPLASGWTFAYGTLTDNGTPYVPIQQLVSWDELEAQQDQMMLPTHGCGSYRIHLRLPKTQQQLGILMPFVWTAYRVEANGRTLVQSGTPDCNPAFHRPQMLRQLVLLPEGQREVTLTIRVADHDFFFAGMVEAPVIGSYNTLELDRQFSNALNLAVIGGLFIMALYHFLIFAYRRKERAMLYFGLVCLTVTLRFASFGDHYLYEWLTRYSGFFHFGVQVRAYYLLTLWLVYFGFRFFRALFPADTHRLAGRVFLGFSVLYSLIGSVVPLALFTVSLVALQVAAGLMVAYLVYVLVVAAIKKRPDARFLLLGLAVTVLAGLHDVLQLAGIYLLTEEELLTFGFMVFLMVQFVVLSRRYSSAYNEVEDLNENLERKVDQRTEELRLASEEIAQKNLDITDSIEYAKRIQLSILPKNEPFFQRFPDSFLYYQPKDIVSGDFYWFRQHGPRFFVCAADCTGHGVPGAFMSVLGSNLLNQVSHELELPTPGSMLQRLHTGVVDALRQDEKGQSQDGMDLALVSFEHDVLRYAGANRPLLLIRKGKLQELSPTKHPIGGGHELAGAAEFHEHLLTLQPGDCLYLFTDGLTDQFGGEQRRKYASKRLRERLLEVHHLPMQQQYQTLSTEFAAWRGTVPQTDDMLLIGIRYQ